LEELQRLESSQEEERSIITESIQFISSLEYTLRNGLPEEKLILIRQCVERIVIDKENNTAKLNIYIVPTNNLKEVEEICTNLIC
jgi:hypothetical protein